MLPPPSPTGANLLQMAVRALTSNQPAAAEKTLRQVLALHPRHPQALQALGMALIALERKAEAAKVLEDACRAQPKDAATAANLGALLIELGDYAQAHDHLRRATRLDAKLAPAWNNLGMALFRLGKLAEADAAFRHGLTIAPDFAQCRKNWRDIIDLRIRELEGLGRFAEVAPLLERCLPVDPDWYELRFFRACALLRLGRLGEGWPDYAVNYDSLERFHLPIWDGSPTVDGKKVLIRSEQGLGEQLMFGSLLPRLRDRADIVVECDVRLRPLLARSMPWIEFVGWTDPPDPRLRQDDIDRQIAFGRMPSLLLPDMNSFGPPAPFLIADPGRVEAHRRLLAGARPLIGLSWASGRSLGPDRKNIPIDALRPLLTRLDARVLVLQYEPAPDDMAALKSWGVEIVEHPEFDPMRDLEGFAATICACDHVLTISNTTAHFAGALGVDTSVLLSANPLWHWFLERPDSPWYASLRLFRQKPGEDWGPVCRHVTEALAKRMESRLPGI